MQYFSEVHVHLLILLSVCLPLSLSLSLSPPSRPPFLSVKQRLSTVEGISCAEFLYPIFQAYDFLQLHKHHGCWMQVGKNFCVLCMDLEIKNFTAMVISPV